jgi:prevent-host-death family protein
MRERHSKTTIGVRELRTALSGHLRRVKAGAHLIITEHGRPIASLSPIPAAESTDDRLHTLAMAGVIAWAGGKPTGSRRRARLRGASVAAAVLEDRR